MALHFCYITLGQNAAMHLQACFSAASMLAQGAEKGSIIIFTDAPEHYLLLQDFIVIREAGEAETLDWRGPHDFFWRIKIKVLEEMCRLYPGQPVVYLDTDTVAYTPLAPIYTTLQEGKALMHLREGLLAQNKAKTERRMWQQAGHKTWAGVPVNEASAMWNAGVVATPNTKSGAEIITALAICDELCAAGVTRRLIEQFALSIALEHHYGLHAASPMVGHYWSTKDAWNAAIAQHLAAAFMKGQSAADFIEGIRHFDTTALPVSQRASNTAGKLHRHVDRLFPAKKRQFLG